MRRSIRMTHVDGVFDDRAQYFRDFVGGRSRWRQEIRNDKSLELGGRTSGVGPRWQRSAHDLRGSGNDVAICTVAFRGTG
jgi:hypothetical protein